VIRIDIAACRGLDPGLFDPDPMDHSSVAAARQVCAGCPVRIDCLALALATPGTHGIWGGLTQPERAAHRRRPPGRDLDAAPSPSRMSTNPQRSARRDRG
jgi:WhiB family transcriptional regulator, redox-sensing transcriptional regulator